jgi:hypothetical protein
MIDVRFRFVAEPAKKAVGYQNPQFRSSYGQTLKKLDEELSKVDACDVVIEAGYRQEDIRLDGWPRGKSAPIHPGAVLYFRKGTSKDVLRFPCWTFARFEANLHAIALTLEALRAIDRYGVTMGHQQYAGFKQIPAPSSQINLSGERAAADLLKLSGRHSSPTPNDSHYLLTNYDAAVSAYREAVKFHHPDAGGDRGMWDQLQLVWLTLNRHFNR